MNSCFLKERVAHMNQSAGWFLVSLLIKRRTNNLQNKRHLLCQNHTMQDITHRQRLVSLHVG